jgi:hypothetical protein
VHLFYQQLPWSALRLWSLTNDTELAWVQW